MEKTIEHIVINGGGPLFFNMYGALKQANNKGKIHNEKVKSYYGTSAGAILSTVAALKYDWDTLDNYLINRPWQQIFRFNILEIYDYYRNNGILNIKFLEEFFTPLFKAKDIEIDVTFEKYKEITGTTIYLYATEVSSFNVVEFSADTTPNVRVIDATYASSALPILFRPIEIEGKIYFDGSVYMNYPIAKCLERNNDPQTIMGIKNAFILETNIKIDDFNFFNYLTYIVNSLFTKSQIDELMTCKEQIKEIMITSKYVDLSNFFNMANSSEERRNAIERGMQDVID